MNLRQSTEEVCHLRCACHQTMPCLVILKASLCTPTKLLSVLCITGSATQLAAVTAASGPEKENLAEGASAIVTAALQLQPLLARAQNLRAKDQTSAFKFGDNVNGELSTLCCWSDVQGQCITRVSDYDQHFCCLHSASLIKNGLSVVPLLQAFCIMLVGGQT